MTPRKELFIAIKTALATVPQFELVDLYRKQGIDAFEFTAALIRTGKIEWQTMTEQNQAGNCIVDVLLFCKDGWMDQHHLTGDPEHGLIEIDLIDSIAEKLQFLKGEQFEPLLQVEEDEEEIDLPGIMAYRISFATMFFRKLNPKYTKTAVTLKPVLNVSL